MKLYTKIPNTLKKKIYINSNIALFRDNSRFWTGETLHFRRVKLYTNLLFILMFYPVVVGPNILWITQAFTRNNM